MPAVRTIQGPARPRWTKDEIEPIPSRTGSASSKPRLRGATRLAGRSHSRSDSAKLLKQHRRVRAKERELACELWEETGYVFTTPTGRPLSPHADWAE